MQNFYFFYFFFKCPFFVTGLPLPAGGAQDAVTPVALKTLRWEND